MNVNQIREYEADQRFGHTITIICMCLNIRQRTKKRQREIEKPTTNYNDLFFLLNAHFDHRNFSYQACDKGLETHQLNVATIGKEQSKGICKIYTIHLNGW